MSHLIYNNPLITRYSSTEMATLFSMQKRISTWRKLWLYLAEAEHELGLPITQTQINELKKYVNNINWKVAEKREAEVRHDVMAHVFAFSKQATKAAPVIHLGATSCYVTDNADLMIMREALELLAIKLSAVIFQLADFAKRYRKIPMLGLTHMQPAQPTTLGKRTTLWLQDLLLDLKELESRINNLPARGVKGTTGTQASFLELFSGNHKKVEQLNKKIVKKMGFKQTIPVSGQTYTRKLDSQIFTALAGLAESAHKFGTDLRLLAHRKELEEPFAKKQIGSSAMAYKRNPMRSERMCSLSRYLISLSLNGYLTQSTQWFERTLDDSANRRLALPEAFLSADAILELYLDVSSNLVVYQKMIARNLKTELPFMATENILMAAVKAGGNRQELHERIRIHAQAAANKIKLEAKDNDLLKRLSDDPMFKAVKKQMTQLLDANLYVGRAPEQVLSFIKEEITPLRRKYSHKNVNFSTIRV